MVCRKCSVEKPLSEFHKNQKACKPCRLEQQRIQRSHPEVKARRAVYKRKARLKSRYGMTLEEYDAMAEAQGGLCAICKQPPTGIYPLVVDHNHETGAVRKLLCNSCNVLLGMAKDNPSTLEAAIAYLHAEGVTN